MVVQLQPSFLPTHISKNHKHAKFFFSVFMYSTSYCVNFVAVLFKCVIRRNTFKYVSSDKQILN